MKMLLAAIYAKIADLRNTLYDKGVFEVFDTHVRTISIGNITAGGTGKTPLAAYVATVLAERGDNVCILTRGYGRTDAGRRVVVSDWENILANAERAGDEPLELARKLLGKAIVVADADRIAAAEMARRDFGVTAFVLDDGFQHRKLKRDLDIVCVDATDPFGGGKMLPEGRLREPLHNLIRADAVVITRSDQATNLDLLEAEVRQLCPNGQIFKARNETARIVALNEFLSNADSPGTKQLSASIAGVGEGEIPVVAFCGLGNPDSFFDQLLSGFERIDNRFDLVAAKSFPDHHRYTQQDIYGLEQIVGESAERILVTTAKDAVKLRGLTFTLPCYVVEIETVIDNAEQFNALL